MKTIVCPTDFSECSENAISYVAQIAKEFSSRIVLAHIYQSPLIYEQAPIVTVQDIDKAVQSRVEKSIDKLKSNLIKENKNLRVETILEEGNAADELALIAAKEHADLIVMGTTGKGKSKRMLIGSTSSQVIANVHCPVLCVPMEAKYNGIKKMVFATDLNEDNINAASTIITFAKHFNAEIIFVFVDNKQLIHTEENISGMTRKIRSHIHYEKMSGYIAKSKGIASGIEYFLKKNPADLLVMFAHEQHFPKTLLHASITKNMLHKIHIPLLALKSADRSVAGAS